MTTGQGGATKPLTVQFSVAVGDVWRDADGFEWEVTGFTARSVNFERRLYTQVLARDVVRQWECVTGDMATRA